MATRRDGGFTLIELLIVCTVVGILAAMATPLLLRAKVAANESSALGSLRAINNAETNFATTCAINSYAVNIPLLVAQSYLSPDMGFNPKSGFNFAIRAGLGAQPGPPDCTGAATVTAYYATGRPMAPTTGRRGFATNMAGTIWQDTTGVPPPEPFAAAGTIEPIQ